MKIIKTSLIKPFNILFLIFIVFLPYSYTYSNIKTQNSGTERILSNIVPYYWPTSSWIMSSPESQDMSSGKLLDMERFIEDQNIENFIDSILIIRNGYLVYESYPSGYDENDRHHIYSCTKVFTSALVGKALEEGYISSINDYVLDFFPNKTFNNVDARKEVLTIKHLLTMTSGLTWTDQINYYQMAGSSDWIQYILDQPMQSEPGTVWNYNTGCSHLLSAILNQVTPNGTRKYAEDCIFHPLNITNFLWINDIQGIPIGGTLLHLIPRDMAKFGFLYLNNGLWNNSQLIASNWVTESKTMFKSVEFDQGHGSGYGYQWWVYNWANAYAARGSYEQYIVVIPDLNMVVVTTGNTDFQFIRLLVDYILPSVGFCPLNLPLVISITIASIGLCVLGIYLYIRIRKKRNLKDLK
ncbi:MAG: serine hydrolase domain-containing protein [Candidatus Thorarchaeota archaeon]